MMTDFFISTDKTKLDLDLITDFLSNRSYWAKGRSRKTISISIDNSICFGIYTTEGNQVGFARVVTDYAVLAWVMDVFILEDYRHKGLGKLLMNEIITHPDLQGLQRWGLATEDAHSLYDKFGFRMLAKPQNMMERTSKPS